MKKLLSTLLWLFPASISIAQPTNKIFPTQVRLEYSIPCTEIKDQSQSPTCWVFGTNSLFESDIIKKYDLHLNLSEMFIARYAYIDKARAWLASKGKTYYEGGGQFRDVIRVIQKYGMVPEEIYSGIPNGENHHNHARFDTAMKNLGQKFLKQGKTDLNAADIKQVNDTLDKYLGKVPETFWYDLQKFTPHSFAKKYLNNANDYVEVMAFIDLPPYQKCLLSDKFNWAGDSLYNITLNDLVMVVDTALSKGWSIAWEGDVTNTGFNFFSGFACLNDSINISGELRDNNYRAETTERNHMLHLVGSGTDENNKKWYYLKNSWGNWFYKFKGYLYMDENYFKLNTVVIMVNKQALPENLKNKLHIE